MTNWKKSPYARLSAALLFVVTALLTLYLNHIMVSNPDSNLMANMQSDRTYYILGLGLLVALPFYFLYRAVLILRTKSYDDPQYAELWQKPSAPFKILFGAVMLLAVVAFGLMVQAELSIYQ